MKLSERDFRVTSINDELLTTAVAVTAREPSESARYPPRVEWCDTLVSGAMGTLLAPFKNYLCCTYHRCSRNINRLLYAHITCCIICTSFAFVSVAGFGRVSSRRGPRSLAHPQASAEGAFAELHGYGVRLTCEQGLPKGSYLCGARHTRESLCSASPLLLRGTPNRHTPNTYTRHRLKRPILVSLLNSETWPLSTCTPVVSPPLCSFRLFKANISSSLFGVPVWASVRHLFPLLLAAGQQVSTVRMRRGATFSVCGDTNLTFSYMLSLLRKACMGKKCNV